MREGRDAVEARNPRLRRPTTAIRLAMLPPRRRPESPTPRDAGIRPSRSFHGDERCHLDFIFGIHDLRSSSIRFEGAPLPAPPGAMRGVDRRDDRRARPRWPHLAGAMTAHRARHARLWRERRRRIARAMTNHRGRHGDSWPARWPLMARTMTDLDPVDHRGSHRSCPCLARAMATHRADQVRASTRSSPVIEPTKCGRRANQVR
jgi:hypothetical protein